MQLFWPASPSEIDLPPGEVHLWSARLEQAGDFLDECQGTLSRDERQRAERFRIGSLRTCYIAGRGILRVLLGRYLHAAPAALALSYQSHGKPQLARPWKESGVQFNMSHSHGLVVYAFTRQSEIGVDVEAVRPMPNAEALLERFFSAEEVRQWREMPAERQLRAFFQGWTRKEAWLKAVGSGLSFPLDEFCVTMGDPARVLSIRGDAEEAAQWWLESSEPSDGYVAAATLRGQPAVVRRWRWEE